VAKLNDPVRVEDSLRRAEELQTLDALGQIVTALEPLDREAQVRILKTAVILLKLSPDV
jgi:hypothetical protein